MFEYDVNIKAMRDDVVRLGHCYGASIVVHV